MIVLSFIISIVSSACCNDFVLFSQMGRSIPRICGMEFILKIIGSRPKAYKNIDRGHPCLTNLKVLKIGVKVPFITILDSIFVY